MFPSEIQNLISHYLILGIIPLDKFLHFFVGAIVTILLKILGVKMRWIFLLLIIFAASKEVIDSFVINNTLTEHINDFLVTFIYPLVIGLVITIKKRSGGQS